MDPISQGIIGSTASQVISKKRHSLFVVALIGLLSGLAPDLDIFIRSSDDPLLFLEFHRQFTHSLIFIPFGGLICASFLYLIFKKIISTANQRLRSVDRSWEVLCRLHLRIV